MTKKILFAVSIITIVILAYIFGYVQQDFEGLRIGKTLTIVIQENEIIDHTKIIEPKMSIQGISYPWFDMVSDEDVQKLGAFLKKNNFKIKSGKYDINQADYFENLIGKLSIEPITVNDKQIYKPRTDKQWDLISNNKFEFFSKLTTDIAIESLANKDLYFYCYNCNYLIPVDLNEPEVCYCGTLHKEFKDGIIVINNINDKVLI